MASPRRLPDGGYFNFERWEKSRTYARMTAEDRLIAMSLYVWQSQFGPIADDDSALARAANGSDPKRVRDVLKPAGFSLKEAWDEEGRFFWCHPVAIEYWLEAA